MVSTNRWQENTFIVKFGNNPRMYRSRSLTLNTGKQNCDFKGEKQEKGDKVEREDLAGLVEVVCQPETVGGLKKMTEERIWRLI